MLLMGETMASIKDLKISNSLLGNKIYAYLGKIKPMGDSGTGVVNSEKKDITNDCILAVADLFREQLKRDKQPDNEPAEQVEYEIEGLGYLLFSKEKPYHKDGQLYLPFELKKVH